MRMTFRITLVLWLTALLVCPVSAQHAQDVNDSIRAEAMERSQILETLHMLTDLYGPRLTGSPQLDSAGSWALRQMETWGLENAHKEPWNWGHPGWANDYLAAHIVSPVKDPLVCEVLAWTPGTDGEVVAPAFLMLPPETPTEQELSTYLDSLKGQMQGKIVLAGPFRDVPVSFDPPKLRNDDAEMETLYEPGGAAPAYSNPASAVLEEGRLSAVEAAARINAFFQEQNARVQVNPAGMAHGIIRAFANRSYDPSTTVPTVVMRNEDYGRIARLLESGFPVTLSFNIVNQSYPEGETVYNYLAEIPGTDKADEVVMLGGHLDSWHAATGATDNATGVAVMMEAVRILKALGLQPRRTIRVALWSGEEQGLLGSKAYVAEHFGTAEDPKPEYEQFGGYLNLDMGTGRVRGLTVFGPVETAAVLEDFLKPFGDLGVLGARNTSSRAFGGSDFTAFNHAGLPGISLGQDPIEYFTHTWHTNLDTYERALEEDLKQAAIVAAATAYHLATRDEPLPRFDADAMPPAPAARR